MPNRRTIACLLAALSLAVAGCSEEETKKAEEDSTVELDSGTSEPAPTAPAEASAKPRKKPKIAKPTGGPPGKLVVKDLIKGKGASAEAGAMLTVNYVGVSFSNGQEFDSSFNAGQPFEFTLGEGGVIPGWDEGLVGLKVGGRRMLTIPPEKAYGASGSPPKIGPNETLVFVIDLLRAG